MSQAITSKNTFEKNTLLRKISILKKYIFDNFTFKRYTVQINASKNKLENTFWTYTSKMNVVKNYNLTSILFKRIIKIYIYIFFQKHSFESIIYI